MENTSNTSPRRAVGEAVLFLLERESKRHPSSQASQDALVFMNKIKKENEPIKESFQNRPAALGLHNVPVASGTPRTKLDDEQTGADIGKEADL